MKTEPVLTAWALTGVIMAGLFMAVSLGWLRLDDAQLGSIEKFAALLLALLLPVLISLWPRSQVTPLAAPKTESGEPAVLVPTVMVPSQVMAAMSERRE